VYLVAEGGSEFGTETGLLQNGDVKWLWCSVERRGG
jgi:hypothetical protein